MSEIDEGLRKELLELLRAGQKMEAIKRHREETGVGLAEAKQAVEALHGAAAAEDPTMPPVQSGCLLWVVLGLGWLLLG